jgi:preprotein translocase subunit SecF
MRLFANAKYDFLGMRKKAYLITAALLVPGLILAAVIGFNYSIEFTGGTLIEVRAQKAIDVGGLRSQLAAQGIQGAEIQTFGSEQEVIIRARTAKEGSDADDTQATAGAVRQALDQVAGTDQYVIMRTEAVGPKVGSELRGKAVLAILLSFGAVLLYLAYRFEWRFGLAAVAATAHDILATIAFMSLLRLEVSLFVVAAILSVVGYSLNDTIVIFDRIRENLHGSKRANFVDILNRSINETLPRTVLTGGTSFGTLIALAALGGDVIRPFALVMLFGVVVGTFSSIFIASPVLYAIEQRWPGADVRGVKPAPTAKRKAQPVS